MRNATVFFRLVDVRGKFQSASLVRILAVWGLCLLFSTCSAVNALGQDQDPSADDSIKIDATLVTVPVIVTDERGKSVVGLKGDDFQVFDDNVRQEITFFDAADAPLNVALLLDTSYSTSSVLATIKDAAVGFLRELRPKDRAMVMSFDSELHLLTAPTADRTLAERAVAQAEIGKKYGTRLNDAVAETIRKHFDSVTGRKAVVLLTDGKDLKSKLSSAQVLSVASETNTVIYTIFFLTETVVVPEAAKTASAKPEPSSRPRKVEEKQTDKERLATLLADVRARREWMEKKNASARGFLSELSATTGGRSFTSDVAELREAFKAIADELRTQYTLGFYPEGGAGTDRHDLRVEVSRTGTTIRSRRHYRP